MSEAKCIVKLGVTEAAVRADAISVAIQFCNQHAQIDWDNQEKEARSVATGTMRKLSKDVSDIGYMEVEPLRGEFRADPGSPDYKAPCGCLAWMIR